MSDTFEFKNLSAAEAMESPSDTTTVLALDGGQVKQIPAGKFGGGSFIVNLTVDDSMAVTAADKTYAEMNAAIEGGVIPVAFLSLPMMGASFFASLGASFGEGGLAFFAGAGNLAINCSPTDEWTLEFASE